MIEEDLSRLDLDFDSAVQAAADYSLWKTLTSDCATLLQKGYATKEEARLDISANADCLFG